MSEFERHLDDILGATKHKQMVEEEGERQRRTQADMDAVLAERQARALGQAAVSRLLQSEVPRLPVVTQHWDDLRFLTLATKMWTQKLKYQRLTYRKTGEVWALGASYYLDQEGTLSTGRPVMNWAALCNLRATTTGRRREILAFDPPTLRSAVGVVTSVEPIHAADSGHTVSLYGDWTSHFYALGSDGEVQIVAAWGQRDTTGGSKSQALAPFLARAVAHLIGKS